MPQPWERYAQQAAPQQSSDGPWAKYAQPQGEPTSAPAPPTGELRPAQTGVGPWLRDLGEDLRAGGGRTAIGRGLGTLQGRGDKGYSGLESGASPEQAQFMGSVPLGLTKTAQGVQEIPQHPVKGTLKALGGAMQTMTIPGAFMGGPAAEGVIESIPSRGHAGQVLSDIRGAAADVPVIPRNTMPALERWGELTQAGGRASKPMTKLSGRLQDILTPSTSGAPEPLNFPEARDFYSNVTDLTHKAPLEKLMGRGLKPVMLRQAVNVRGGLHQDLIDAANQIGRGQEYADAIREYANASKLRKILLGAGVVAGTEGLRRAGVLGKIVSGAANAR